MEYAVDNVYFFNREHAAIGSYISESDMSSDSGSGCVDTRMWRQQTTRHINVCSHLKCHWWRWNQTRKHLLQSILSGYLNSSAMIFLSRYGPVARTSNLLRLSGRHHVFPTGPAAAVSVLSHIASFWKQSEVGNSKMAISWKRWILWLLPDQSSVAPRAPF